MTDIYETPKASLESESTTVDSFGSIEKGIRGEYRFSISEVLSEAWEKTSGAKGTFILAFLIYIAIAIGLSIVAQIILTLIHAVTNDQTILIIFSLLQQIVFNLILLPIGLGIFMLGIRRAVAAPIQAGAVVSHYASMWKLLVTLILMYLMIVIGFALLIIPGIYLTVAYYMALPLVVEKGLSPWQALEVSRKTISKRWFTMFFFTIIISLIIMLSMIPVFIGLIWTFPMMMIAYGIIYRNMFGVRNENLA
jgi:uncharacterized membrane protein